MRNLELAITAIAKDNISRDRWDVPLDYFSWGRDKRHKMDNSERMPNIPIQKNIIRRIIRKIRLFIRDGEAVFANTEKSILSKFRKHYEPFDRSYQLMSDQYSRNLFAELIFMKIVSEKSMRLSSFTQDFIESYEEASRKILESKEIFQVYNWILRKITLNSPQVCFFTVPTTLNLHLTGRLYRYQRGEVLIEVKGGDVVIDAGVGWGDTTIYLSSLVNQEAGGHLYAFDILEEGLSALSKQRSQNPKITNITPILRALSDKDDDQVNISSPSPGARVINKKTGRTIQTITIDTFCKQNALDKVDFIKMDIEGAEVPALLGATNTIKVFKPQLAISVYHKWDDLLIIPQLIKNIRDDYNYYLNCTTGFGGETILYCR